MEDIFPYFPAFLLIMVRVTTFFVAMPIFSYRSIPIQHRIGLGIFLAWIMYYTIEAPVLALDVTFYLLIIKEAFVGFFIGFAAYMILSAVQVAGGLIDFQMGFSIANVIDPQTGAQSPLMGQYLYTIALLFLLSTNGHHLLLDGIFYSYQFIPIDQLFVPFGDQALIEYLAKAFSKTFMIAFQMSIPVVGSIFLVDVTLGILARTVPQLNVFVVGIPVKIIAGLAVIVIVMGMMMTVVTQLFNFLLVTMRQLMQLIGGV
ncbi:flagellar biosynthetic protein FliR [Peribacillus butanolivorans]|uniref:Flagellar biosynthetic protein FliR n=1 Tax=Peribacillus butanolivorans TaxID=421767 RepID=A0AAX0RS85_9BACI|nr:flagellar biosynthetic protein FliR [Peribacillus butanolivorans]AXN40554.1 flagellar type III secretion system protein FliR [Peribacillus butanolivorans]PEJ35055.1 flagellar biosynthetic protein FliR [Peribacillus butanolivorans]